MISTGSQGEPLSALRRMANNDHRDVQLHSGDTVVFSAAPVPGNERAVNETIDRIYEIGATVVTAQDAPIHASGHGWQEELKLMLNLTKPRFVLPPSTATTSACGCTPSWPRRWGSRAAGIFRSRNGLPLEVVGRDHSLRRGHPRRHDVRRRRQHRRPRQRRPARPSRDLRRRVFIVVATVSSDDGAVVADPEVILRGVAVPRRRRRLVDEPERPGRRLARGRHRGKAAQGAGAAQPAWSRRICTTRRQVRPCSDCAGGRWCCRSWSRYEAGRRHKG